MIGSWATGQNPICGPCFLPGDQAGITWLRTPTLADDQPLT